VILYCWIAFLSDMNAVRQILDRADGIRVNASDGGIVLDKGNGEGQDRLGCRAGVFVLQVFVGRGAMLQCFVQRLRTHEMEWVSA